MVCNYFLQKVVFFKQSCWMVWADVILAPTFLVYRFLVKITIPLKSTVFGDVTLCSPMKFTFTGLHSITFQTIILLIVTAMRISNLIIVSLLMVGSAIFWTISDHFSLFCSHLYKNLFPVFLTNKTLHHDNHKRNWILLLSYSYMIHCVCQKHQFCYLITHKKKRKGALKRAVFLWL
jgi:hypothetical protein